MGVSANKTIMTTLEKSNDEIYFIVRYFVLEVGTSGSVAVGKNPAHGLLRLIK